MPEGLSNTAFGDLVGVSEGAVRKAEKKGRIKRFADGSIDGAASAALWKSRSDPARTKARPVPRTAPTSTEAGPSRELPAEVVAELVEQAAIASTLVREVLRAEGHVVPDDVPIDFDLAKTAEKIIQVHQRKQTLDEGSKRLIDANAAGRRWADEIVKLRARMLAIPGDCALELSHLTKHEISVIDRIMRDAMEQAAGDGPP